MILLYLTLSCILSGSSATVEFTKKCYGGSLRIPFSYSAPLVNIETTFTPSNGGSKRVILDKGEAKDPRLKVYNTSAVLTDLTKRDEGSFISHSGLLQFDMISLTVLDCSKKTTRTYGAKFSLDIPSHAEFLEFTPFGSVDLPEVLWNRTDPQTNKAGRGQVKHNVWEIKNVNQADSGHYNVRSENNTLLSRIQLSVEEYITSYDTKVNRQLLIQNPPAGAPWTVTFKPNWHEDHETLINEGRLVTKGDWNSQPWTLRGRIQVMDAGIQIDSVESTDSGTFEFRDLQGYLVQTVHVVVNEAYTGPDSTFPHTVAIVVGIVLAVLLCCCCQIYCCKSSSSESGESAPQTATVLPVYHHDLTQPEGSIYSDEPPPYCSLQPFREPTAPPLEPLVHNPCDISVSFPQPEVLPPGGNEVDTAPSFSYNFLPSDPGCASAPPICSDSTSTYICTSDGPNFL